MKFKFQGNFTKYIITDLISQGLSGQLLCTKFKELNMKIASAIKQFICEADKIVLNNINGATFSDIFGKEVK